MVLELLLCDVAVFKGVHRRACPCRVGLTLTVVLGPGCLWFSSLPTHGGLALSMAPASLAYRAFSYRSLLWGFALSQGAQKMPIEREEKREQKDSLLMARVTKFLKNRCTCPE